jgi:hypothetical protein
LKLSKLLEAAGMDHKLPKNASYTSPVFTREVIDCLSEMITISTKKKLDSSRYVSIQVDESTDVATKSHMIAYLRGIDAEGNTFDIFAGLHR